MSVVLINNLGKKFYNNWNKVAVSYYIVNCLLQVYQIKVHVILTAIQLEGKLCGAHGKKTPKNT